MLSLGTCASYIVALVGLSKSDRNFIEQHLANCILLLAANVFGLMSYFLEDAQQRRAFLETRQSLQVKLVIEEQSAEQERLLLSVLPEHVAVKMRQDLGSTDSQFKKIYMSRHENVSILYADIVGFTAISSTYSAQDLVKILNELFARFDRLAEKYQQLRIKILGDCYYCISGAPVERPDHAVLCVHMGLSMVKAIKYVQQTTNSPVDMRVGIHTGAVLAGVLGQRQWQFDVYSKDVELANKMESSGMAGRVHISHQTLSFLDGEFEVEPAHGEKREEALRMAGIKTYFIVKVLKPYSTPVPEVRNGAAPAETEETILAEGLFDTKDESKCNSPVAEESQAREDSDDFKNRLRTELISRDGHRELQKRTSRLTLRFRSASTERQYGRHREPLSAIPLLSLPLAAVAALVSQWIAVPLQGAEEENLDGAMRLETAVSVAVTVVLGVVTLGAAAETAPKIFPRCLVLCSRALNDSMYVRRVIAILGIVMLAVANTINMSTCDPDNPKRQFSLNCTSRQLQSINTDFLPTASPLTTLTGSCNHPSYFSCSAALCLITAAILPQLSHLTKAILMTLVTGIHCALNLLVLYNRLDCEDLNSNRDWTTFTPGKLTLSYMLIAVTIALSYLARHMERVSRVSFLWKTSVTEQREKASDMRQRNEALVYNVLPPHVAAHFMGQRKRQHDELYSQSYAEVGVLFASMPNFSDFYSEETVNNQGLECLRFLNEVISDFDALLELPQFKDIIKIKTIGSTYMAASGLKPTDISPNAPITTRWSHLALLVDFALELKRALQCINEQSFNHFVLKMGVNHGPITAGVIGARKPHYDIWGNTVNVASRMESTGKAGAIQVTEETCDILQHFGYTFEQRGLVAVKGKGQLMTYYLQGKTTKPPASPLIGLTTMETLQLIKYLK
ncbi:adenylate cyclase type 3 [Ctenocephalides felis]|uniref:adenylate cyclase type 3 n=1 Tax=Ctenocephalides felis TaxID=7515 RepID=UPI000E6E510A|nr:adenylate cyclase type 3 [Ctenocephalides felis]